MLLNAPFYSQRWNLDSWENLGFLSREEALYWQNSSCGIICLKMAVEGITGEATEAFSSMIRKGARLGAYSHTYGWSHDGLTMLAHVYGVQAFPQERMNAQDLIHHIDSDSFIIVSVKSAFQSSEKSLREKIFFWKKFGGHLALVTGYNDSGFQVHHTSIFEGHNWENITIPFDTFKKAFTGRGIVLQPR